MQCKSLQMHTCKYNIFIITCCLMQNWDQLILLKHISFSSNNGMVWFPAYSLQIIIILHALKYTQLIATHAQSVALSNTGKVMGSIPMNIWTGKMYTFNAMQCKSLKKHLSNTCMQMKHFIITWFFMQNWDQLILYKDTFM